MKSCLRKHCKILHLLFETVNSEHDATGAYDMAPHDLYVIGLCIAYLALVLLSHKLP